MPSHQERVRRNYHTVTGAVLDQRATNEYVLNMRISKMSIASWASPRAMRDVIMRNLYAQFEKVLPR